MASLNEYRGVIYFLLAARWLPEGTTQAGMDTLTVGDLRLSGKELTKLDKASLARSLKGIVKHVLAATIPSPRKLLDEDDWLLPVLVAAIHESEEDA